MAGKDQTAINKIKEVHVVDLSLAPYLQFDCLYSLVGHPLQQYNL